MFRNIARMLAEKEEILMNTGAGMTMASAIVWVGIAGFVSFDGPQKLQTQDRLARRNHFIGAPDEITKEFYNQVEKLESTTDNDTIGRRTYEEIVEARWKATGQWNALGGGGGVVGGRWGTGRGVGVDQERC